MNCRSYLRRYSKTRSIVGSWLGQKTEAELLYNSRFKKIKERKKKYDMLGFSNTMSFAYMNPGVCFKGEGGVCYRERQGRRAVGALICLRIRDNAWVYGGKEEGKVLWGGVGVIVYKG